MSTIRPIDWGEEPEFFGPRHEAREDALEAAIRAWRASDGVVLDAASGLGSFSRRLVRRGFGVVSLDRSWTSLLRHRAALREKLLDGTALLVLGDVACLPFRDNAFAHAVSAETLEHIDDDGAAAAGFGRVLRSGGELAVTTPAGPERWSEWDEWAEHRRRYSRPELVALLERAGFRGVVCRSFGFPLVRAYDALFLRHLIRRRARPGSAGDASLLVRVARRLGRCRLAVGTARAVFAIDRLFGPIPAGVGWTVVARRAAAPIAATTGTVDRPSTASLESGSKRGIPTARGNRGGA